MNFERTNNSYTMALTRIILSTILIVVSILCIYKVIDNVMQFELFSKINVKQEKTGIVITTDDTNSIDSLFITDEKGLRFRKEDKSFAREEWIDKNGELFYFDTDSYGINGDLKIEGQIYSFENGKLKSIKRDRSYSVRADKNLYSSIESVQYLVYLDTEEKKGNYYPIKYKKFSDDIEDYLGTANDMQYSSPNMMKIYINNIYYLAVGKGYDFSGKLCRMRPNAETKEVVGSGVEGYIALSDDVVYYYDGNQIIKVKSWQRVSVNVDETDDGDFSDALNSVPVDSIIPDKGNVIRVIGDNNTFDFPIAVETTMRETVKNANNNEGNEEETEIETTKKNRSDDDEDKETKNDTNETTKNETKKKEDNSSSKDNKTSDKPVSKVEQIAPNGVVKYNNENIAPSVAAEIKEPLNKGVVVGAPPQ